VLPDRACDRMVDWRRDQRSKRMTVEPIDLSAAGLLRRADTSILRDASRLETELLPALGLEHEMLDEDGFGSILPPSLRRFSGTGLQAWQMPNQFAAYLTHLSRYPIRSYLEIGVRRGGTFVITTEYLNRFRTVERAVGIDIAGSPSTAEYARTNPRVRFARLNARSPRFRRLVRRGGPWDLVLIDGDHREQAVRRDLEGMIGAARIIAFHDIVTAIAPGVRTVWDEFKSSESARFDFFEFDRQYDEVVDRTGLTWQGIGVAVERSFGS
jgi:Methyltransferase domain